jgi:hypothetical protein
MLGRGRIKTRGKKATDQVIITSDFGEFEWEKFDYEQVYYLFLEN